MTTPSFGLMRKFSYFNPHHGPQKLKVRVASVLDVSNVIIIPNEPDFFQTMDEKMIFQCMFYYPHLARFSEVRGLRVRLQDVFYNIRENRHLAWICVEFSKLLFIKLNEDLEMRIMARSYNSELMIRLYTKEIDIMETMANIYKEDQADFHRQHLDIVRHQSINFGEVCINDILSLYSKYVITTTKHEEKP
jgi:hypothetical protein